MQSSGVKVASAPSKDKSVTAFSELSPTTSKKLKSLATSRSALIICFCRSYALLAISLSAPVPIQAFSISFSQDLSIDL